MPPFHLHGSYGVQTLISAIPTIVSTTKHKKQLKCYSKICPWPDVKIMMTICVCLFTEQLRRQLQNYWTLSTAQENIFPNLLLFLVYSFASCFYIFEAGCFGNLINRVMWVVHSHKPVQPVSVIKTKRCRKMFSIQTEAVATGRWFFLIQDCIRSCSIFASYMVVGLEGGMVSHMLIGQGQWWKLP